LHSFVALDVDVSAAGIGPLIALELSLLSGHCRPYDHADLRSPWLQNHAHLLNQTWWQEMLAVCCSGRCCLPVDHAADGVSSGVSHAKLKYDLRLRKVTDFKVYLAVAALQSPAPQSTVDALGRAERAQQPFEGGQGFDRLCRG